MPKIRFKQGDIVWADFSPSVGQEMKGKHPAVVVSSNSYNEKTNYLMLCPLLHTAIIFRHIKTC